MPREIKGVQFRELKLNREAVNQEKRTVDVALSSETPVERWFGTEILDHGKGSVDLSRMEDGGAVLCDHDPTDVVGVMEDVHLDSDRVLRGTVRFGQSARAQEVFQDVLDGIRSKVSIGYDIQKWEVTKGEKGASDTIRATRWQPMEMSFVSIPADARVGVGRALDIASGSGNSAGALTPAPEAASTQETRMSDPKTPVAEPAAPNITELRSERSEAINLRKIGEKHGIADKVDALLGSDRLMGEIRGEVLKLLAERNAPNQGIPSEPTSGEGLGMSAKDVRDFSFTKAIRALATGKWDDAKLEREVSDALNRKLRREDGAFLVPTRLKRAGLVAGTATAGGDLVQTELRDFIDILTPRMKVMALGATMMGGLQGNVAIPRQTQDAAAYWVGENPGTDVTQGDLAFDQVTLTPHNLMALEVFSRQLVSQSSYDVEGLVRRRLAVKSALAWDAAAINGSGSSNQPKGILNTSGIGSVAIGTNGGVPTYATVVGLESAIDTANADIGDLAYLTTPGIKGVLKQTAKLSNTIAEAVWGDVAASEGSVNGYRAASSTQVPSNLTKGTSSGICHAILLGVWPTLILGEWGAMELTADPYTLAGQAMIRVISHMLVDVQLEHPEAFAACKDATLS